MKIAAITEDGKTISQHFGRAPYYMVVTMADGAIVGREMRDKLGHAQFVGQGEAQEHGYGQQHGHENAQEHGHGFGAQAHDRHLQMAEAIADCEVLLCRGMGRGAYQSMQVKGIRPIVTDIPTIEAAVQAFSQGTLIDHVDKLH